MILDGFFGKRADQRMSLMHGKVSFQVRAAELHMVVETGD